MKKLISTKMKIFLLALFISSIICYTFAAINLYYSNYNLSSYLSNNHNWSIGWNNYTNSLSGNIEKDFPNSIENINIITTSSNVSIFPHDASNINVDIRGDFDSNHKYNDCIKKFDITDKDINIETSTEDFFNDVSLNIYIPNNFNGNINLKTTSGDMSISSLKLSNLLLSSTSGEIKSYNVTSSNSKINSTSGSLDYTGSLGECTISSTSGDIELNLSDLGNNSTITSTSGEIDVNLASAIGYKANISSTSGDIEARNNNTDNLNINKSYTFTNGDGTKNISIHTTSGDISIY